jgi:hypothetical protein
MLHVPNSGEINTNDLLLFTSVHMRVCTYVHVQLDSSLSGSPVCFFYIIRICIKFVSNR